MRVVLILTASNLELIVYMFRHYYKCTIPITCLFNIRVHGLSVSMAFCLVLFFSFHRRLSSEFWEEDPYFFNTMPLFFLRKVRVP